jgi:hypothetical protein
MRVENHGTLFLFRPEAPAEREWLEEHTDGTWFGGALVVEPRYVEALLEGHESNAVRTGPFRYRGFDLAWDPDARAWAWTHEDYDGPGDPRAGHVWRGGLEAAKAEVDAFLEEAGEKGSSPQGGRPISD